MGLGAQIFVSNKGGYYMASVTCLHEQVTCLGNLNLVRNQGPVILLELARRVSASATQPLNSQSADNAVARVSQFLPSSGPLETHSLQLEKQE